LGKRDPLVALLAERLIEVLFTDGSGLEEEIA
jgi:hypothetical protein